MAEIIQAEIPAFREISKKARIEHAEKRDLKQVLGKELIIKDAVILPSKFGGRFAIILAEEEGVDVSFPLGSDIVISQLEEHKDDMPFRAKIVEKQSKTGMIYHTFE